MRHVIYDEGENSIDKYTCLRRVRKYVLCYNSLHFKGKTNVIYIKYKIVTDTNSGILEEKIHVRNYYCYICNKHLKYFWLFEVGLFHNEWNSYNNNYIWELWNISLLKFLFLSSLHR